MFIDRGAGSHVWDVDGNEYVDFHNGFGVMVVGHAHPVVVAAVTERMSRGSHFAQPVAEAWPSPRSCRGASVSRSGASPTAAPSSTLDAVRLARGFTGRERLIKIEASYHGHHNSLLVSVEPPRDLMGPVEQPNSVPYCEGIPRAGVDLARWCRSTTSPRSSGRSQGTTRSPR